MAFSKLTGDNFRFAPFTFDFILLLQRPNVKLFHHGSSRQPARKPSFRYKQPMFVSLGKPDKYPPRERPALPEGKPGRSERAPPQEIWLSQEGQGTSAERKIPGLRDKFYVEPDSSFSTTSVLMSSIA